MKKFLYIDVVLTFFICFLTHSFYDFFKNSLTLIFFPVNESIWEHGKMVITAGILLAFIELLYFKFRKIEINNIMIFKICASLMSILLIYIFSLVDNFIFHIILLLVCLSISSFVLKFILQKKEVKNNCLISLVLIILIYLVYGYLTYQPLEIDLFLSKTDYIYGLGN